MSVIAGVAGSRPRHELERNCRSSIDAQSLYYRRTPRIATVNGASFGSSLFETTPEDFNERQPLTSDLALLVADARIDNRGELLALLNDPRLGRESADSDILMAGWGRWKHALFSRVIGSFAIAIFDSASRSVILARGISSDRPLCYRIAGDELRFASMPSGLLADAPPSPNLRGLAHLMVCADFTLNETAFANVSAVPPAHYLAWSAEGHRLVRFWQPPTVDHSLRGDVLDEFRHILDESVRCRLRRVDGPIASHLSSGLDSGAVTATAARLVASPRDLIAYTMAPAPGVPLSIARGRMEDETALAAVTASALGIEQQIVSHSGPLLDALRGHARIYQAPVPNVPNHGWGHEIYKRAQEAGAKVLFSATIGNSTLSYGGVNVLSEWLQQHRFLEYFRQLRALVRSGDSRLRGAIFYSIGDYVPPRIWMSLTGSREASAANLFIRDEWMKRVAQDRIGSDYEATGLRKPQYGIYANCDGGIYTKATLADYGLDERDPATDRRLIEFCLRLPPEQYINHGVTRRLAKVGLADRLPPAIIANRVRGYQGTDWFAKLDPRSALEWIEEIDASASAHEILDLGALRRAVDNWDQVARLPSGSFREWGNRFTRALAVGAFLREIERDAALLGRRTSKPGAKQRRPTASP